MSRERRLGRGLEALLGRAEDASTGDASQPVPTSDPMVTPSPEDDRMRRDESGQLWLNVYAIDRNPYQPREDFDEASLAQLIDSIQEHGVLQPLVVRRVDDRFQLITGERRLRAATAAGWERVPVQIREADDRQMAELAIVENMQRKDLNAIEKAASFARYLEEYGCTKEVLASRLKIDRSTVSNLCRLLELPEDVQAKIRSGKLSSSHARSLLPLGDEREQIAMAERILREGWTVRATEEAVAQRIGKLDCEPLAVVGADGERRTLPPTRHPQLVALEQEFRAALGTKVALQQTSRGKGKITIHFKNREEFERLRQLLVTCGGGAEAAGG